VTNTVDGISTHRQAGTGKSGEGVGPLRKAPRFVSTHLGMARQLAEEDSAVDADGLACDIRSVG
jgi:hypothetical protein